MMVDAPNPSKVFSERVELLHRWLRVQLDDEDYAAMAGPGYRPRDWNPDRPIVYWNPFIPCKAHEQKNCRPCSPHRHPREVPVWQEEIDRLADLEAETFSLALRERARAALLELGWRERMVIELHCVRGLGFMAISIWRPAVGGQALAVSHDTIWRLHAHAMRYMVRAVWGGNEKDGQKPIDAADIS